MRWIRLALIQIMVGAAMMSAAYAQATLRSELEFTPAEEKIIARNEVLTRLRRRDPDGVKDILDALRSLNSRPAPAPAKPGIARRTKPAPPAEALFDPARNPDLLLFHRASPEAAHDLLQLLKQAGAVRR